MTTSTSISLRQAARLFQELRKAFTPLTHLYAPLLVGYVGSETLARLNHPTTKPEPIFLLQQGTWYADVKGLGDLGQLTDGQMADLLDAFEAARNLLECTRQNIDALAGFLEQIEAQPNAGHVLGRCLREPGTRTVWMTRQQTQTEFPSEEEINKALDEIHGKA